MSNWITCFARETGRARRGRGPGALVRILVLLLGASMGSAVPAAAQSRAQLAELGISVPTNPRNAATWYVRAMDELAAIDPGTREILGNWNVETAPSRAVRRALRAHEGVLDDAEAATPRTFCDFQANYEEGWELLLPHLNSLRQVARTLRARAAVALFEGRSEAAAQDIERIQRMAVHVASDEIMISSLVSMAVASMADEMIDLGFRRGQFGPAEAAVLLDATQGLARPGAFRLRSALATERGLTAATMERRLIGVSPEERVGFFTEMLGADPASPEMQRVREASEEQVRAQTDGMDRAYEAVDAGLAELDEDPEAAMAALTAWEEDLVAGAFGELAMVLVPSITRAARHAADVRERMQAREVMLRSVMAGDAAASWLDAAVHLRAAIEVVEELAQENAGDAEAAAATTDRVLAQLAAAAAADHFDELVLRVDGDSLVVPAWAAGARRVLGLLADEAARHLAVAGQAEQPAAGAEAARLAAVGLRLVRHLASSRSLAVSRVAQEHLERIVPLVQSMPRSVREDPVYWDPVVAAAGEIVTHRRESDDGRRWLHEEDALLGYPRTTVHLRGIVAQAAADLRARIDGTPSPWGNASVSEALDADMLAILTLATERVAGGRDEPAAPLSDGAGGEESKDEDARADAAAGVPPADRLPRIAGLDGIADAEAMVSLEARVPAIRRAIVAAEQTLAEIAGPDASPLAVRVHQREARRLIRALRLAVDPVRAAEAEADAETRAVGDPG